MEEEQNKIQNEISELEQLIDKAAQNKNDPESVIAGSIFTRLLKKRMAELGWVKGGRPLSARYH